MKHRLGQDAICLSKVNKGEFFHDLDMLTKLLTPKSQSKQPKAGIQVLDSAQDTEEVTNEEDDIDWFVEQVIAPDDPILNLESNGYGFANKLTTPINSLNDEISFIDLINPDNVSISKRGVLRYEQEEAMFDCEHYLADYFDKELIDDILSNEFEELTGVVGKQM